MKLCFIFDRMFSVERGSGYSFHRKESQQQSRLIFKRISFLAHLGFAELLSRLPDEVVQPVLNFPYIQELLAVSTADPMVNTILSKRVGQG
jgi:hypothetical protein